ncbi:MAG: hypothetical protein ABI925_06830 [Verrucomicrobiota bacterium]
MKATQPIASRFNRRTARIALAGCAVVLLLGSYEAGRQTALIQRARPTIRLSERASQTLSPTKFGSASDTHENIRLENLGRISFGELYDLIHSASPEQRSSWAKQLESLTGGPRKLAATEAFFKVLIQLDANAAVQLVAEITDRRARRVAIDAVLGAFREADIAIVAEMIIRLHATSDPKTRLSSIAREWLQIDPAAAVKFMERHRDQLANDDLYSFMWDWSIIDPAAAHSWFEHQDRAQQTDNVIRGVVLGWYQRDPAAAVEFAVAHLDLKGVRGVIGEIANGIVRDTSEQPVDFINEMPTLARNALIDAVIQSTKVREPSNSPSDVARWLVALPNSIWTGRVAELLTTWERKDGPAVLSWIDELPMEKRAQLLTEHSPAGEGISPERIFELAVEIPDHKMREAALQKFSERLGPTREEALKSLQKLSLSVAQKHYVRSFLKFK